jgi:hypothetical protein
MRLVLNEPVEGMKGPYRRRWWALLVLCLEWSHGAGEEIRGPIAALLLLLTGREAAAETRLTRTR